MTDEWGDLILWHGEDCPVPGDEPVEAVLRNMEVRRQLAKNLRWEHEAGDSHDIIAYRRRKQPETRTWYQYAGGKFWDREGPMSRRTFTAQVDRDGLLIPGKYTGPDGAKIEVK